MKLPPQYDKAPSQDPQGEAESMNFSQILAASTMTTFLAASAPAIAVPLGYQPRQMSGANITAIEKPCQPLSWEAANRLPSWLSGSYVACMNPTIADLQASRRARALLVKADRMQEQGSLSTSEARTEYANGIVAYAEGRYVVAITHLQAAMPSVTSVQFKH
jgi:hypothetical protein